MAYNSKIEWCDTTWNPTRGCSIVSEGCHNCYAMRMAARFSGPGQAFEGLAVMGNNGPRWTGKIHLAENKLRLPLGWKQPRKIFVDSMSDLFHDGVPDEFIHRVFAVMAHTPQHTYMLLTKRPERMHKYLNDMRNVLRISIEVQKIDEHAEAGRTAMWPLKNVWLGVSIENQETADQRIPLLLDTPAALRWLSCEPLLGPVDLGKFLGDRWEIDGKAADSSLLADLKPQIGWVVVGGESGPGARYLHPDWVRTIRDQVITAEVPFFFKQWGAWLEFRETAFISYDECPHPMIEVEQFTVPTQARRITLCRIGKTSAGNFLDGKQWLQWPEGREVAA